MWTYEGGKPYLDVSDEILEEFESAPLMVEQGDGTLVVNPRYYQLEQYLE